MTDRRRRITDLVIFPELFISCYQNTVKGVEWHTFITRFFPVMLMCRKQEYRLLLIYRMHSQVLDS